MAETVGARRHLPDILEMRRHGETLQTIGDKYGITRERVRQILAEENEPLPLKEVHYRRWFGAVAAVARQELLAEFGTTKECGTATKYGAGCRCDACRRVNRIRMRELYRRWRAEGRTWNNNTVSPEQRRAHQSVSYAISVGKLTPAERCEGCGARDRLNHAGRRWLQAHHDDHSQPLDVLWLCPPCHKSRDRLLTKLAA